MSKTSAMVVTLLMVCGLGCTSDWGRFGPYYTPRVNAAKAIDDSSMRDDALRRVGQIAMDSGDAIAANDAVDAIHRPDVKDDLAARSARTLFKREQWGQATAMAKKITDTELRDRVLREIATGRS